MRETDQRLASLEHDARQLRLPMKEDEQVDTKTRERTEGAATTVQAMHGDSRFANRVDPNLMYSTSFGDDCTGPPAPPCSGKNALVDDGAAAPKSCLPPVEMRTTTTAGGLLPTGKTSTATKITFNQPPLRLYSTEKTNLWTSTISVSYASSFFWKNKLLAAPFCRKVIETKFGQNRMFDPGGSQRRLRACPFLGTWRALLFGEVYVRVVRGCSVLWRIDDSVFNAVCIAVNRWFFEDRLALNMPCQDKGMPSRAALGDLKLGANNCWGASWSEA